MSTLARILTNVITKITSFRVIVAVVTSSAVTASVAGPLAYQAIEARNAVPPPTTTTTTTTTQATRPPTTVAPTIEPTTSTTSTTTSTTVVEPINLPASTTTVAPSTTLRERVTGVEVYADKRDSSVLLDGTRITGQVYVYSNLDGATAVTWFLDDPTGAGTPLSSDAAPDLQIYAGTPAPPFDTTKLTIGLHTLLARVTLSNGTVTDRVATFEVAAGN